MRKAAPVRLFAFILSSLLSSHLCFPQAQPASPNPTMSSAQPLLLEQNEGELRTRRPRPQPSPASQFRLKVGPRINGSKHLVVGTEQIAPGASIPTHKHPSEDELVFIHSGTAHVRLGDQQRDLHAGGLIFIPANTWIGLENVSSQPLDLTFVFSAPGFDDFQTCISVPAGVTPRPMTDEGLRNCEGGGHMVYKSSEPESTQLPSQRSDPAESELRELMAQRVKASMTGDSEMIERTMTNDYLQTDIFGHVQDKSTWLREYFNPLAELIRAGKFHWDVYEQKDLQIQIHGVSAVVVGSLTLKGTGAKTQQHTWVADPNATLAGTLRFTHVYVRSHGTWMLSALHNAIPATPQVAQH